MTLMILTCWFRADSGWMQATVWEALFLLLLFRSRRLQVKMKKHHLSIHRQNPMITEGTWWCRCQRITAVRKQGLCAGKNVINIHQGNGFTAAFITGENAVLIRTCHASSYSLIRLFITLNSTERNSRTCKFLCVLFFFFLFFLMQTPCLKLRRTCGFSCQRLLCKSSASAGTVTRVWHRCISVRKHKATQT